jgi:hypothetical protein
MIDKRIFFSNCPQVTHKTSQVHGTESIVDEWFRLFPDVSLVSNARLAYVLATTYHETATTMQPIEEYGKGHGRKYGEPIDGHVYYGRGFVQLTWQDNYIKATRELHAKGLLQESKDLARNPELALDLTIATHILIHGMLEGWFTGKTLSHYINNSSIDFVKARKIINGIDKAHTIAMYAKQFNRSLQKATIGLTNGLPS